MGEASDETKEKPWEKLEGWDRTFAHMWELCFRPEIERRQSAGLLPKDFFLYIAQALFPPEGRTVILLNEEVRGEGLLRAPRAFQQGDHVRASDLQYIERFELPDELLDNGHFTIIRGDAGWRMLFNFLSGRAKAKDMLELAAEFVESSLSCRERGHAGPAVDALFSASELVSKAELILHRSRAVKSKTHRLIASEINAWARLGNIDAAFVALFNKLGHQRPNARYGNKQNRPPMPSREDFDLVSAMIERGLERVGKATDRNARKTLPESTSDR